MPDGPLDRESAAALASLFTAMSDPTRVQIISLLGNGQECCVQDIAAALEMSHSAVSHQLRLLRQLRVVRARQEGRQKFYTIDDDHVERLYLEGLDHLRHG